MLQPLSITLLLCCGIVCASASAQSAPLPDGIQRLLNAYPDHLVSATANSITWKDGTVMNFDDGKSAKTYKDLLDNPDLQDIFAFPYPVGTPFREPARNEDPGRIRYEPFFFKMYGASKEEVSKKLTTVYWMPKTYNVPLRVTTVNGVHERMKALSAELDNMPQFHKYLADVGGTFNWRKIAGTNRQSTHSFGTTIDINVRLSDYWRWNIKDAQDDGKATIVYRNRIPLELVAVFEKHGFIWGGKWYHYDTMHFEYRPELLPAAAAKK